MIIPQHIQEGSTIGIIAPAGRIRDRNAFDSGVRVLHEMGFHTKFSPNHWPGLNYFSDSDHNRAKEFMEFWDDVEVDCIMCARGGYGSLRLLHEIGYFHCCKNPKLFVGFSDITIHHTQINTFGGVATIHGPVVTSLGTTAMDDRIALKSLLTRDIRDWCFYSDIDILRKTQPIKGISTGGNLSTLISTIGTSYAPKWENHIVFLEDTGEYAYKIDKMLTQLKYSGLLDQAKGFVLGDFGSGLNLDRNQKIMHHELIWERILELTDKNVPVWGGFPFGHGERNFPIPLGLSIILNCNDGTLRYSPG